MNIPPNTPQSLSSSLSAYAQVTAIAMLVRSVTNELLPRELRSSIYSAIRTLFTPLCTTLTLVIDEYVGMSRNQIYDDVETYLQTKIDSSMIRLMVTKTSRQKNLSVSIEKGQQINDVYEDVKLKWRYVCSKTENNSKEKKYFELWFKKKHREKVVGFYLRYVISGAQKVREEEKVVKLYSRDCSLGRGEDESGVWGCVNLEHPSTFDTLAMHPEAKRMLIDDLDRFVRRREFYKKVGKAWKRGYLLYGPPGTGKSSLIAAMANYLKFDVYDLELSSVYSKSELRRILLSTSSRSILVIKDIDCSGQIPDRQSGDSPGPSKLTLLDLLNFIDGLWSTCGDERIILFTTNHKDRLDPALLHPGRMDVHINMSYCTHQALGFLISNYLGVHGKDHYLYGEARRLVDNINVTPAEVAEELMRSEDVGVALRGLVNSLKRKKDSEPKVEGSGKVEEDSRDSKRRRIDSDDDDDDQYNGIDF